jgi:nitroreductase
MDVIEAIKGRRAVRDYAPEPLEREQIAELIGTAVLAPSAMNRQPWTFAVVQDKARLERWSAAAKRHVLASLGARPELQHFRETLASDSFNIFYNAPALIVISATAEDEFTATDCALAAQTLMLAAHAGGLGTCWIGFAHGWLNTPEGRSELGIAPTHVPVAPIILGRPRQSPLAPPRRPPEIRWMGG